LEPFTEELLAAEHGGSDDSSDSGGAGKSMDDQPSHIREALQKAEEM
jgi:hypothetical protein